MQFWYPLPVSSTPSPKRAAIRSKKKRAKNNKPTRRFLFESVLSNRGKFCIF